MLDTHACPYRGALLLTTPPPLITCWQRQARRTESLPQLIFTGAKSTKNVVEAHKWVVKNKTLCIGLTKGKTAAFHKQNKLNGPS